VSIFVVLLGPPGAGKGTQAARLAQGLDVPHISSGDLFREHLQSESDLGREARRFINQGELVPDDVTIGMLRERLSRSDCGSGAILDGFPRTLSQAQALDEILEGLGANLKAVLYLHVSEGELIGRLTGRWMCSQGHIYNLRFNPPQEEGICDLDGTPLYQRDDDQEQTVRQRIQVYHKQTMPLVEYYTQRDLLVEIDGDQPIDAITTALMSAVNESADR